MIKFLWVRNSCVCVCVCVCVRACVCACVCACEVWVWVWEGRPGGRQFHICVVLCVYMFSADVHMFIYVCDCVCHSIRIENYNRNSNPFFIPFLAVIIVIMYHAYLCRYQGIHFLAIKL